MGFVFWGIIAALIAVIVSSVELLTRYQARSIPEIFLSWYYLCFAVLNAFLCFVVYLLLPSIGRVTTNVDLLSAPDQLPARAIAAGLGYLVVARLSIIDLTIRGGTYGFGFDGIYQAVAQYLLGHHNKSVRRKLREDFGQVYNGGEDDPVVFLGTVRMLITQLPDSEKPETEDQVGLALRDEPPPGELCLGLYFLIRDLTSDSEDAANEIERKREEIRRDSRSADELKNGLSWLYKP